MDTDHKVSTAHTVTLPDMSSDYWGAWGKAEVLGDERPPRVALLVPPVDHRSRLKGCTVESPAGRSPRPQGNLLTQLCYRRPPLLSPHSYPCSLEFYKPFAGCLFKAEDLGCLSRRSVMSGPLLMEETPT